MVSTQVIAHFTYNQLFYESAEYVDMRPLTLFLYFISFSLSPPIKAQLNTLFHCLHNITISHTNQATLHQFIAPFYCCLIDKQFKYRNKVVGKMRLGPMGLEK